MHGDPATPIFKSYTGDRIVFRTMMPADKPRNVGLAVHGHLWKEQPKDCLLYTSEKLKNFFSGYDADEYVVVVDYRHEVLVCGN